MAEQCLCGVCTSTRGRNPGLPTDHDRVKQRQEEVVRKTQPMWDVHVDRMREDIENLKGQRLFVIELQEGVWLTSGEGDPPRTLSEENATKFTRGVAMVALDRARIFRPFPQAKLRLVIEPHQHTEPTAIEDPLPPIPTDKEKLKEYCFNMREDIEDLKGWWAGLIENHPAINGTGHNSSLNGALPNAWMVYRSLEDARMRLGKVLQALDGGKDILPR